MPNTAYGLSKLKAERYLQGMSDFPYVIYRPTGVYGPREKDYFLMAKSIRRHTDFSVGFRRQDLTFVYVKDIVQAVFLGIEKQISRRTYFWQTARCTGAVLFRSDTERTGESVCNSSEMSVNYIESCIFARRILGETSEYYQYAQFGQV